MVVIIIRKSLYDTNLSGLASLGQSFGDSPEWFLMRTHNGDEGDDNHHYYHNGDDGR